MPSPRVGGWVVPAKATGYDEEEWEVEIAAGRVTTVDIHLRPLGGLSISGQPADAIACVTSPDGSRYCSTLPLQAAALHHGQYLVHLVHDGYQDAYARVEVRPMQTTTVQLSLKRMPETVQPQVEPKSGLIFVYLPGGTFHYGCEPQDVECDKNERPGREATVRAMWMGKTDVSVDAYGRCVRADACDVPSAPYGSERRPCTWGVSGRAQHPVNCISARRGYLLSLDRRMATIGRGMGIRGQGRREPYLSMGRPATRQLLRPAMLEGHGGGREGGRRGRVAGHLAGRQLPEGRDEAGAAGHGRERRAMDEDRL